MAQTAKHILLVGAGHAHLGVLARAQALVRAGARLTLVCPDPAWYFADMAAEVLGGYYGLADFRVDVRALCARAGAEWLGEEVVSLLPEHRQVLTATGRALEYDLASFAVGSLSAEREGDVPVDGSYPLLPVQVILEVRNELETLLELEPDRSPQVLVLGGGPTGVETALALAGLLAERSPAQGWTVTLIEGRARVLPGGIAAASRVAERALARHGVKVRTGTEIQHVQSGRVVLEHGETLNFDLALTAMGNRVTDLFGKAGLHTDDFGALLVDRTLRSRDRPELFAAGDCARLWGLGLPRTSQHAIAQAPVLAHNLLAVLRGAPLRAYAPAVQQQWLALGPREALWVRGQRAWHGSWVLALKRRRERAYVRALQRPAGPPREPRA
jgi:NADH dehydrogenase FAD-containing subunit